MKQINGTVTLSFLEEDNQQRVIFRVIPLCTREGVVFRDKSVDFPDQGSLRIVPDKREQSTFKERMRSMGNLCAIQLCSEGKELAKVRQNRNYDPAQGELNQFAIYSDVICEFAEDGIFEVFSENAAYGQAFSQRVLLRRGQVLYGPLDRDAQADWAILKPFGNDSYLLQNAILLDGGEHTFYWNPELTVTWRQRRGTLRRGKVHADEGEEEAETAMPAQPEAAQPVASEVKREPALAAPAAEAVKPWKATLAENQKPVERAVAERVTPKVSTPVQQTPEGFESLRRAARTERRREPESDTALPIGARLSILDDTITFEEQISKLDQPLSLASNFLGSNAAQNDTEEEPASARFNGTPLVRVATKTQQPIRHGEPLHYVVEKQIRTAHREHPGHEEEYRHIENPIENLNVALAKAWEAPEIRQQAILSLCCNDVFMQALTKQLHAQGREQRAVDAAQEQLQDIEAERLSLLMQLDGAKNDYRRAMETMQAELTHKKRDELAALDAQVREAKATQQSLLAALTVLGEQVQQHTLSWFIQNDLQLCACNGDTVVLSPLMGNRRTPAEMIAAIRVAMNRQGFACNEDDATELLLHFALNDEFCICADTLPEAELCARTMLEGLGLAGVAARTYDNTLFTVASLLPPNGLRTPTVEVCPMGRVSISPYGHKTVRLMDMRSPMPSEPPLPVVYAPVFRPGIRESRAVEPVKPVSLDSLSALREEAKPLWEQGEKWFNELDERLSEQSSALAGQGTQQMRLFVSAAANRLRGGFIAAADAAVLGWVVPAVCRRELNAEPLRQAITGLPRCLSALGIQ